MKHKRFLFIIAGLIVSCTLLPTPENNLPGGTESTASSSASQTTSVTFTPIASPTTPTTPVPPKASPTAKPSLTSTPNVQLKRQCLPIALTFPSDANVEGFVVLGNGYALDDSYLLNVMTGQQTFLPPEKANQGIRMTFAVSPNRQWLAYGGLYQYRLIITATDGKSHQSIAWQDTWRGIAGWLDNERVLISRQRGEDKYDSLIVLNPFTGQQQQELLPNYPDILAWYPDPHWSWFDNSKTVYSSDLNRVVYPGLSKEDMERLFLWDVQASQQIAVITGTLSFGVTPKWSPDGQRFVISGPSTLLSAQPRPDPNREHEELFSVGRDGEVIRLTYLTDFYSEVAFTEYAWSPDGRYVAFALDAGPGSYPDLYPTTKPQLLGRLAVLDTTTQEITDYCIPVGLSVVPPVWSPDSRQIVVEDYYQSNPPYKGNVYLIDVTRNFAVQIAENMTPFGWMKSSP